MISPNLNKDLLQLGAWSTDSKMNHVSYSGFFKMSKLILFHYSKGKNYDSTDGSNDIYDKYKRSCHIRILLPLY